MLHLRRFIRPLVVLALLATALALVSSPAAAQTAKVFRFENTDPSDDWEVRVTIESFGGCGENEGRGGGSSDWLERGDQWGEVLDLDCSYTFSAIARNEVDNEGELCDAELAWNGGSYGDELRTRGRGPSDTTDVDVRHEVDGGCDAVIVATFAMDPDEVVEDLPRSGADASLEARAERAVEVAEFKVRVGPDASTKSRRGCNQVFVFPMSGGDDGAVEKEFPGIPTGSSCKFRVTIEDAPGPFDITDADGLTFNTSAAGAGGALDVDLTRLVRLPYARIAIVQDVRNSNNQGTASYSITRSCAGVDSLPPTIVGGGGPGIYSTPGGNVVATLSEGRFTVHSPNFANFGAGANYLAVAEEHHVEDDRGLHRERVNPGLPGELRRRPGDHSISDLAQQQAIQQLRLRVRHRLRRQWRGYARNRHRPTADAAGVEHRLDGDIVRHRL